MSWMPDNSYVKSAFKDSDGEKFKFRKKKKKKVGEFGTNLGEAIRGIVNVNKKTNPL